MSTTLWWLGQNTITVAILIPLVAATCRLCRRRPAVQHALWLIVLLKLVTPPIVSWPWTLPQVGEWLCPSLLSTRPSNFRAAEQASTLSGEDLAALASLARTDGGRSAKEVRTFLQPAWSKNGAEEAGVDVQGDLAGTELSPFAALAVMGTFGVWLAGAVVCMVWQLRRVSRHASLVRRSTAASPPLLAEVRATARRLGLSPPRALLAPGILSPFIWCLGRLRLVWPDAMASAADVLRSRGIIAHELAHVRRGDHRVAWLELAAGPLWWWNPLYWFVRRRLRETAEMACDALAVATRPDRRREYAELLLEHSAGFQKGAPAPVLAVSAGTPASFERRLSMILSDRVSGKVSWPGMLAAIGLALVALPGWSLGQSQPPNPPTPPPEVTGRDLKILFDAVGGARLDVGLDQDKAALQARIKVLEEEIAHLKTLLKPHQPPPSPQPNGVFLKLKELSPSPGQVILADSHDGLALLFKGAKRAYLLNVSNQEGTLTALDLATGRHLWRNLFTAGSKDRNSSDLWTLAETGDGKLVVLTWTHKGKRTVMTFDTALGTSKISTPANADAKDHAASPSNQSWLTFDSSENNKLDNKAPVRTTAKLWLLQAESRKAQREDVVNRAGQARAELEVAERLFKQGALPLASLEQARAQAAVAEATLKLAQDRSAQTPEVAGQQRQAQLEEAAARMAQAEAQFKRLVQLYEQKQISAQELEAAKANAGKAAAEVKALKEKLSEVQHRQAAAAALSELGAKVAANQKALKEKARAQQEREFDYEARKALGLGPDKWVPATSGAPTPERAVKIYPLQHARAAAVSRILKALFADKEGKSLHFTVDETTNLLLVRGSAADQEAVAAIVERLEASSRAKANQAQGQ
jgi:beta-lactamase regulating signal transducer with metallopeptidase domain